MVKFKIFKRETSEEDKENKMMLQLALDFTNKKKALKICKKVSRYIDIIEIGTPLIKAEGVDIIKSFKKFRKPILADMKTMDVGFLEEQLAYRHGANLATVCGTASDETIKRAIKASKKYKKKIVVDLISVKNKFKRAKQVLKWGANYICVHTGIDIQRKGGSPFRDLIKLSKLINKKKICVAGGITLKTIDLVIKYKPGIVVVGGGITKAKNPEKTTREIKDKIKNA